MYPAASHSHWLVPAVPWCLFWGGEQQPGSPRGSEEFGVGAGSPLDHEMLSQTIPPHAGGPASPWAIYSLGRTCCPYSVSGLVPDTTCPCLLQCSPWPRLP